MIDRGHRRMVWLLLLALGACGHRHTAPPSEDPPVPSIAAPAPVQGIAIVGASFSAGLGGRSFAETLSDLCVAATSSASVWMFREPLGDGVRQLEAQAALRPRVIVALDFLFWHVYGVTDQSERRARVARGLADLMRVAGQTGAQVVVGTVPRVTTASELLIAHASIPSVADLAEVNAMITASVGVRVYDFAALAEPLARNDRVRLSDGREVAAATLMTADGLHPNRDGARYVIDALVPILADALSEPLGCRR